jgi:hypothetical protein
VVDNSNKKHSSGFRCEWVEGKKKESMVRFGSVDTVIPPSFATIDAMNRIDKRREEKRERRRERRRSRRRHERRKDTLWGGWKGHHLMGGGSRSSAAPMILTIGSDGVIIPSRIPTATATNTRGVRRVSSSSSAAAAAAAVARVQSTSMRGRQHLGLIKSPSVPSQSVMAKYLDQASSAENRIEKIRSTAPSALVDTELGVTVPHAVTMNVNRKKTIFEQSVANVTRRIVELSVQGNETVGRCSLTYKLPVTCVESSLTSIPSHEDNKVVAKRVCEIFTEAGYLAWDEPAPDNTTRVINLRWDKDALDEARKNRATDRSMRIFLGTRSGRDNLFRTPRTVQTSSSSAGNATTSLTRVTAAQKRKRTMEDSRRFGVNRGVPGSDFRWVSV